MDLALVFRPHGRALIVPSSFAEEHAAHLSVVRRFPVADALHLRARLAADQARQALESRRAEMISCLTDETLSLVIDSIEHMAPLLFYVGDESFSNFYQVGQSGYPRERHIRAALDEIVERGARQASIEAVTLAYGLHLLRSSGSYTRPEEMNSCQLTPSTLQLHFRALATRYQGHAAPPEGGLDSFDALPLSEQAARLAVWRKELARHGRFVRDINGLNLLKKERFLRNASLDEATRRLTLRAQSIALIEDATNGSFDVADALATGGSAALLRPLPHDEPAGGFASRLEQVIDAVVRKAVELTGSDVGMTRGARSFLSFAQSVESGAAAAVCAWTQAEYFCHAVPSRPLDESLPRKAVAVLLNAVSARMRYNSWHYAPSYFDAAKIPPERGWFHAPQMADLARWSDHHHSGHVHASVRYSIRSPQPVRLRDRALPGFVDLRLMRRDGEPYTLDNLGTAIAFTEALGLLYQALMDEVLATGVDFVFRFGDKQWFNANYLSAETAA